VKIQIIGSGNVFPLNLKQTFPPIIEFFTEGKGDGMESSLSFNIFSTLVDPCPQKLHSGHATVAIT
jgi:hypothetical protein